MKRAVKLLVASAAAMVGVSATAAEIVFYEGEGFRGRMFTTDRPVGNFERRGFNNRASSVVVERGRWEACEEPGFRGRCVLLRPGSYESLDSMGVNNRISSVRPLQRNRSNTDYNYYEPEPRAAADYPYRRRPSERLVEVPVTSARAVVGPPEQRCWLEREQVEGRGRANVGGAIAGAIIGGILGHQVGSGRGQDAATAGGAVAGGALGANAGRRDGTYDRDVQRCETVADTGAPEYWDVTYEYRGVEHRVQLSHPPGRTITVNQHGEPRG
jgi:uncharacterized protein YcfJ